MWWGMASGGGLITSASVPKRICINVMMVSLLMGCSFIILLSSRGFSYRTTSNRNIVKFHKHAFNYDLYSIFVASHVQVCYSHITDTPRTYLLQGFLNLRRNVFNYFM